MLDFSADWCVACKEMERFTFSDPRVQARLAGIVLLRADVTHNTAEDKSMLKRFRLFGPPGSSFSMARAASSPTRASSATSPPKNSSQRLTASRSQGADT